jgi:hypothetical protein
MEKFLVADEITKHENRGVYVVRTLELGV